MPENKTGVEAIESQPAEIAEELLTPKQKEGLFKLLDKVRDGVLNNEQFLLAMKLFVEECDKEEEAQS